MCLRCVGSTWEVKNRNSDVFGRTLHRPQTLGTSIWHERTTVYRIHPDLLSDSTKMRWNRHDACMYNVVKREGNIFNSTCSHPSEMDAMFPEPDRCKLSLDSDMTRSYWSRPDLISLTSSHSFNVNATFADDITTQPRDNSKCIICH